MDTTTATQNPAAEIKAGLAHFTGTSKWYRHPLFRDFLYTDGTQFLAERAGAYWLIEAIAGAQLSEAKLKDEEFQVWRLHVHPNRSATLTCSDGDYACLFQIEIEWTDFPLDKIDLWFRDGTLYLPSEH